MNWQSKIVQDLKWSESIINKEGKQKVAKQIAEKVKDGDVIGVGSGSTSYLALFEIAEKVKKQGLNIKVIPTSFEISLTCANLELPLTSLLEERPDWLFDGADEVDPNKNLIKGRGGALFKEKLLMNSSPLNYIIIDDSKLVPRLGSNFPIPVEVFPHSMLIVETKLKELGAKNISLRLAKGKDGPVITENGNLLLDVRFEEIELTLESSIKSISGVIESGLFINYNIEILVASNV